MKLEEQVRAVWSKAVCIEQVQPGQVFIVKPDRRSVTILGRGKSRSAAWSDALENCRNQEPPEPVAPEDPEIQGLIDNAPDMVNHPPHYQSEKGVECIDAIEAAMTVEEFRGYLRGNCLKYLWRSERKGGEEDLKKAAWYLNKLIETPKP